MTGRISDMDAAAAVSDADLFETVQGGANKKQTALALKEYAVPFANIGDLLIGGSGGAVEVLPIGTTAGQVPLVTEVDGHLSLSYGPVPTPNITALSGTSDLNEATSGQAIVFNGTDWVPGSVSGGGGGDDGGGGGSGGGISFQAIGAIGASQIIGLYTFGQETALAAGLPGAAATCEVAPTDDVALTISHNGTTIGTVNFAASATSATFDFAATVSFGAGDVLSVVAPESADGTLSTIALTIAPVGGSLPAGYASTILPDLPFVSPSTLDDEFTALALNDKWNQVNIGTWGTSLAMNSPGLTITFPNDADSGDIVAVMQPLTSPTEDFTAWCKVSVDFTEANYQIAGLILSDGITSGAGEQQYWGLLYLNGGVDTLIQSASDWTSESGASENTVSMPANPYYLRIRRASGTFYCAISSDGKAWQEFSYSISVDATNYIGLMVSNRSSSGVTDDAHFDFFRVVEGNGNATLGGVAYTPYFLTPPATAQAVTLNRQAGDYTALLADDGAGRIASTDASANTVTLPGFGAGEGEVQWRDGASIKGVQLGAGQVTIAVSGGATTLRSAHGSYTTYGQYSTWGALYDAVDDAWVLYGDLSA